MKNNFNFLSIILIEIDLFFEITTSPIVSKLGPTSNNTLTSGSPQTSSSLSNSAIATIIIVSSLTFILFCFFLIVFLHYRLIRKLPDDEMGSSQGAISVSNKKNSSPKIRMSQFPEVKSVSMIETVDNKRVQFDLTNRFALKNDYNLINLKPLSESHNSIYTPIDNLSEFDEATSDLEFWNDESSISDDEENVKLYKKKSESCENFVIKLNQFDSSSNNLIVKSTQNKSVILNVMNMSLAQKIINNEKSYL